MFCDRLLQNGLGLDKIGLAWTDPRANQSLSQNRQQRVIFITSRNAFARDSNCLRGVSLEQIFMRSCQVADLASGREFGRDLKVLFGLIKPIKLSEEHSAFVVESRRLRQVL